MSQPYMGTDFQWFVGVVEDRQDPLMLGRIRVRALGWYTEDKNKVPTDCLPWAYPVQGITSAAMSGVGHTPMGPVEGTWVVGFFKDGAHAQEPVILGTLGGIPDAPNPSEGFNDPNGQYPRDDYIGVPDTHRRGRNENVFIRNDQETVRTACGVEWTEPADPYNARYPFNHIYESESGHQQEYDDTERHERTFRKHRMGTFEEIHPDGSRVHKIVADNYTIIAEDDNVWIKGTCNITIEEDCNMKVKNFCLEVEEDMKVSVGNDYTEDVGGNKTTDVVGNFDIDASRIDLN